MFREKMNLNSILSNLRTISYHISRSGYGYRNASNTATVLTDVSNSLLKNPSKHEAIRNMFNTQLRGKLSKVYIEWHNKQVSNMVQTAAAEIQTLVEPKIRRGIKLELLHAGLNLWKTAREVSNAILEDMKKVKDEQNMKTFHLFEVDDKGMDRYSPSGAQGDQLRFRGEIQQVEEENENECSCQEAFESKEMHKNENFWNFYEFEAMDDFGVQIDLPSDLWSDFQFEWLRTKSEMREFDKKSERIVQQVKKSEYETWSEAADSQTVLDSGEKVGHTVLSDVRIEWPDNIHDEGEVVSPDLQTKPVFLRKHKSLTTEGAGSLREDDGPSPRLAEWMEPLRLCMIDWIALLDGLKQHTTRLYFKVAKLALGEESFKKTKMRDYSMLVEAHLNQDTREILKKMNRGGISPVTTMLNRYIMGGKPGHAKDALECLRSQGFQLDTKVIYSMIMACINAGGPKLGESLMTVAESSGVQLTEEMYIALLWSYSQLGDVDGAIRIATGMESSGFLPSLESCNLLVRAFSRAGEPHEARRHFDHITKLGLVPDEKCIANALVAYERKRLRYVADEILLSGVHRTECGANNSFSTVLSDCLASSVQLRDKMKHLGRKIEQLLVKIDEKKQQ